MGAYGAQPKADAVRPRSMDAGLTWIDLPPEGCTRPVPSIPYHDGFDDWCSSSKQMWITLWQSPEATQWNRVTNVYDVYRYVDIHDKAGRNPEGWSGAQMTAALSLSEKLGLTPAAKRRLYWRIKPEEEVPTMPNLASVQSIKGEELR